MRRNLLFLVLMTLCFQIRSKPQEVRAYNEIPVGVILDMGSWVGKTANICISMAVSDFYMVNSHYNTRIVVHNKDTNGEPLHALSAAVDLLAKPKVQAIISSESIVDAKFLAVLGDEVQVPILSLSPTPSSNKHPYFFQITQDETAQLKGISAIAESFGWKNVIVICEDTDNGHDMAKLIAIAFRSRGILVTYTTLILTTASSELVHKELYKLKAMHSKFFVIHVSPSLASHFFLNAKHLGMMDAGYKWIITSKTTNFLNFMDGEVIESMQGVVGFKSYFPNSRKIQKFVSKWREGNELTNINAYAIWAYDAVSALAMAVESTQALRPNSKDINMTGSAQRTTAELLNQMLKISFDGLGGAFRFMNGRLSAQILEIINLIGKGERRVGFWRSEDAAFTKKLVNSFSDDGFDAIVWPGGIQANPTHRMLQTSNRLRIGIPLQERSFGGVFLVHTDAQTNKTVVSGYSVDVLIACFHALNQNVELEFILANGLVGAGSGHYQRLIDQVHAGEFDGGVGDITITANRSKYVDFTLPFSDLGLGIVTRNADTSMWIFMKPLSSDLWVISGCFFVLLGFVIWILEHRINEEFQGSPVEQIGTTIWFAFSTIVYAHRQKLQSNLSRFVVTVWLFVVLVLVSSYTATLSSVLTVEQIQLASKRGSIGYSYDASIVGVLGGSFNNDKIEIQLIDASGPEYYADALLRGSKKGGADAVVAEIPYIKEFLVKYPTGYTMTPSEVITNGFGFPFPLGSPWAPLISTQIAKLREDGTLKMLENKWLNPGSTEAAPLQKVLNFKGLRGLFLISGVSMAAALFLYMLYYIHDKWHFNYAMLAGGKLAFIMNLLTVRTANEVAGR